MMTDDTTTTPAQASMAADARERLVTGLVTRAHAEGGDLVGPDGLLAEVTKRVLETGLDHAASSTVHAGGSPSDP